MSPITTHVLDITRGCPAPGIAVTLEKQQTDKSWAEAGRGQTNSDGRLTSLLAPGSLKAGVYRLRFATAAYFASLHVKCFFPEVLVTFEIGDAAAHYHVPLLLSPYGYSTYRGS